MGLLGNCQLALIRPFDDCLKLVRTPVTTTRSKRCFTHHDLDVPSSSSEGLLKKVTSKKKVAFKDCYDFCCRRSEFEYYAKRYPNKIALIIERFKNERVLDELERGLFIVPEEMTIGQLQNVVRKQLGTKQSHNMPIYFLVNGNFLPSNSVTIAEIAYKHRSPDGFVYLSYASKEMAG